MCFRNLFLNLAKMDPFRIVITISSIRNKVFRTIFLKQDSVDTIARGGYRLGNRQSVKVLQWLAYIGRNRNIVTHAGIPYVKVDGYCEETNVVF